MSIKLNSQLLAFVSELATNAEHKSSSTKDHVHLDTVQTRRECHHKSGEAQKPQELEVAMCRCVLTSPVGSDCFESHHKNILSLPGTCVFQRALQDPSSIFELDAATVPSNQASLLCLVVTNILYVDLTEKWPFFSNM